MTDSTADIAQSIRQGVKTIWWLSLTRGIFAVVFGILALIWPEKLASALALLVGIYLVIDGAVLMYGAYRKRADFAGWPIVLAQGAIAALVGVFLVALPAWSAALLGNILIWTLIAWSLIAAGIGISRAVRTRDSNPRWKLPLASNVMTAVLSLVVAGISIADPSFAISMLVWISGLWALIIGIGLIFFGLRLRRDFEQLSSGTAYITQ